MALELELETYMRSLNALRQETGKFVLIHGEHVVGVFASYEEALKAGYSEFKLEPFLVNPIETEEMVQYINRHAVPVPLSYPTR